VLKQTADEGDRVASLLQTDNETRFENQNGESGFIKGEITEND
jgi:hypothetical protein